jgi:hypothetical protein
MWCSRAEHDATVERIQRAIRAAPEGPLAAIHSHVHHITRRHRRQGTPINCSGLNHAIQLTQGWIEVEPDMTMEQLCAATLPHGLMAPVIPEFKGITVGGAISGTGGESSSYKWGLFSDTCLELELLLGNGDLVRASPNQNADLFYAMAGAFGSLAIITAVRLALQPAPRSIQIAIQRLPTIEPEQLQTDAEYCEGVIYSPSHALLLTANGVNELADTPAWTSFDHYLLTTADATLTLPLIDYLFRWDQGAFWMARPACHPFTLLTSILTRHPTRRLMEPSPAFFEHLLQPILNSTSLYKLLHRAPNLGRKLFVIQDFLLPAASLTPFLDQVYSDPAIFPIWLCPIRNTTTPQLFSPHYQPTSISIDVGIYGVSTRNSLVTTQTLESLCHSLKGRKMLYAATAFDPAVWRTLYDYAAYEAVRARYHATRFTPIDARVGY